MLSPLQKTRKCLPLSHIHTAHKGWLVKSIIVSTVTGTSFLAGYFIWFIFLSSSREVSLETKHQLHLQESGQMCVISDAGGSFRPQTGPHCRDTLICNVEPGHVSGVCDKAGSRVVGDSCWASDQSCHAGLYCQPQLSFWDTEIVRAVQSAQKLRDPATSFLLPGRAENILTESSGRVQRVPSYALDAASVACWMRQIAAASLFLPPESLKLAALTPSSGKTWISAICQKKDLRITTRNNPHLGVQDSGLCTLDFSHPHVPSAQKDILEPPCFPWERIYNASIIVDASGGRKQRNLQKMCRPATDTFCWSNTDCAESRQRGYELPVAMTCDQTVGLCVPRVQWICDAPFREFQQRWRYLKTYQLNPKVAESYHEAAGRLQKSTSGLACCLEKFATQTSGKLHKTQSMPICQHSSADVSKESTQEMAEHQQKATMQFPFWGILLFSFQSIVGSNGHAFSNQLAMLFGAENPGGRATVLLQHLLKRALNAETSSRIRIGRFLVFDWDGSLRTIQEPLYSFLEPQDWNALFGTDGLLAVPILIEFPARSEDNTKATTLSAHTRQNDARLPEAVQKGIQAQIEMLALASHNCENDGFCDVESVEALENFRLIKILAQWDIPRLQRWLSTKRANKEFAFHSDEEIREVFIGWECQQLWGTPIRQLLYYLPWNATRATCTAIRNQSAAFLQGARIGEEVSVNVDTLLHELTGIQRAHVHLYVPYAVPFEALRNSPVLKEWQKRDVLLRFRERALEAVKERLLEEDGPEWTKSIDVSHVALRPDGLRTTFEIWPSSCNPVKAQNSPSPIAVATAVKDLLSGPRSPLLSVAIFNSGLFESTAARVAVINAYETSNTAQLLELGDPCLAILRASPKTRGMDNEYYVLELAAALRWLIGTLATRQTAATAMQELKSTVQSTYFRVLDVSFNQGLHNRHPHHVDVLFSVCTAHQGSKSSTKETLLYELKHWLQLRDEFYESLLPLIEPPSPAPSLTHGASFSGETVGKVFQPRRERERLLRSLRTILGSPRHITVDERVTIASWKKHAVDGITALAASHQRSDTLETVRIPLPVTLSMLVHKVSFQELEDLVRDGIARAAAVNPSRVILSEIQTSLLDTPPAKSLKDLEHFFKQPQNSSHALPSASRSQMEQISAKPGLAFLVITILPRLGPDSGRFTPNDSPAFLAARLLQRQLKGHEFTAVHKREAYSVFSQTPSFQPPLLRDTPEFKKLIQICESSVNRTRVTSSDASEVRSKPPATLPLWAEDSLWHPVST